MIDGKEEEEEPEKPALKGAALAIQYALEAGQQELE